MGLAPPVGLVGLGKPTPGVGFEREQAWVQRTALGRHLFGLGTRFDLGNSTLRKQQAGSKTQQGNHEKNSAPNPMQGWIPGRRP
jgi:hypothetical protein